MDGHLSKRELAWLDDFLEEKRALFEQNVSVFWVLCVFFCVAPSRRHA